MTSADASKPSERIFLSFATVTEVEEQTAVRVFHSGWVAPLGPEVGVFEAEIAKCCGADHALAPPSGIVDLHLALLAPGIGEDDYIPVPTMTFAATTNVIAYVSATPAFVDVTENGNINPKLLFRTVDKLLTEGKNVSGVAIIGLFGRCAGYPAFMPRLEKLGIVLIEDTAEVLGASVDGQSAGGSGRTIAPSFNGGKIMTTSGGGMLLLSDADLIARACYLSTQARQPVAWYEHTGIGYSYRLSNLLAILGRAQHSRLDDVIVRRRQIRDAYIDLLVSLDDDAPGKDTRSLSDFGECLTESCWLTSIVLPQEAVDKGVLSLDGVIAMLGEANIEARHLRKPMHLQPVYEDARVSINGTTENLFSRGITFPSGPALDDDDVARVISVLKEVLGRRKCSISGLIRSPK